MISLALRAERRPNVSCSAEYPSICVLPDWIPACPLGRGAARLSGSRPSRNACPPLNNPGKPPSMTLRVNSGWGGRSLWLPNVDLGKYPILKEPVPSPPTGSIITT